MSRREPNYIDLVILENELMLKKDALYDEWQKLNKIENEYYKRYKYAGDQYFQQKHELWEFKEEKKRLILDKHYHDLTSINEKIQVAKQILDETEEHYLEAQTEFAEKQAERDRKHEKFHEALDEWKSVKEKMDNFTTKSPPST